MQLPLELSSNGFQGILDSQADGESIECLPHEYAGPIYFKKETTIEGHGATFWALEGPVVIVESDGVTLRDLRIEVTADTPKALSDRDCALIVKTGVDVRLENVEVRGAVRGLKTEEGTWHYPFSLNLGEMLPGLQYEFLLRIVVPVQCQTSSLVAGIDVIPAILTPGKNEVRLRLSSLSKDSLVCGSICLRTALLKRRISIVGRVLPGGANSSQATAVSGTVLWTPTDWEPAQPSTQKSLPCEPQTQTAHSEPLPPRQQADLVAPLPPLATESQVGTSSSAPVWQPSPSSTRIRKQSTPLSKVWSTPVEEVDKKIESDSRPVISSAFQQASQAVEPSPIPETPSTDVGDLLVPRETTPASSQVKPKSRPITIGIFGGQGADVPNSGTLSKPECKESAESTLSATKPTQSPEHDLRDSEMGPTPPEPNTKNPKDTKPRVPNIFLK